MRAKARLLGTALGALLLPLSVGTTAHAAQSAQSVQSAQDERTVRIMAGSCSSGNFCMFDLVNYNAGSTTSTNLWRDIVHDDDNFAGNHWRDGNGNLTSHLMDNRTSSIKNESGCRVYLWSNPGYSGENIAYSDGAWDPDLGARPFVGDNAASSADFSC